MVLAEIEWIKTSASVLIQKIPVWFLVTLLTVAVVAHALAEVARFLQLFLPAAHLDREEGGSSEEDM